MISESYFWKKELLKSFQTLAKFRIQKRRNEASFVNSEKAIMISAYIIRKLTDANKIPINFLNEKIQIKTFLPITRSINRFNCFRVDEVYNLNDYFFEIKDIRFLLNQLIHSFIFEFAINENNLVNGIFLNSDKNKDKKIYYIEYEWVLTQILKISEGNIIFSSWKRRNREVENLIVFNDMEIINQFYGYDDDFNLQKEIKKTLDGNIYKRTKEKE